MQGWHRKFDHVDEGEGRMIIVWIVHASHFAQAFNNRSHQTSTVQETTAGRDNRYGVVLELLHLNFNPMSPTQ